MKKWFAIALSGSLAFCAAAGDFLFRNGATDWTIGISPKASKAERYAAEELQTSLEKISGVKFPVREGSSFGKNTIVIGTPATSADIKAKSGALKLKDGKLEELAVYTLDGRLYLAGSNPRGALYAVYSFLKNQLGVRWFWPGEEGEFITKKTEYKLPVLKFNDKPQFRFRDMSICCMGPHMPTETWMARNFINMGNKNLELSEKCGFYLNGGGNHDVGIHDKKMFATHPEYFALIEGKRRENGYSGCWSNPGFTKYVLDRRFKTLKSLKARFGQAEIIVNMFPSDVVHRCECAECTKEPNASARWFLYHDKLAEAIRKVYPDVLFAGMAYQEYRDVPACEVKGVEYVRYCQYNRCYIHKLNDPSCKINQKTMDELRRWGKKAPMGIYGYHFDIFDPYTYPMYLPFWNMLADEAKVYRDMKLPYIKTEMPIRFPKGQKRADNMTQNYRLAYYMYAQLIWNPDADVNALLKDWCDHVYGAGSAPMLAYHTEMAKNWDAMPVHISYVGARPGGIAKSLLNEKVIRFGRAQFKAAEEAVKKEKDSALAKRHASEIALEKELFEKWVKCYELAKENAVTATIPFLEGDDAFGRLRAFPMKSRKGTHQPSEVRIYWNADALYIQAVCMESDPKSLRMGKAGRDDVNPWHKDTIELFLDLNDGSPYRHMAMNLAGGIYDAMGLDTTWNPVWKAVPKIEKDRWSMTIKLPFSSLGVKPKEGDQWKLVVIRNGKPESCGYPMALHHNVMQGATLLFSGNTDPDRNLVWFDSPHNGGGYRNIVLPLNKRGWQSKVIKPEEAGKADISGAKVIVVDTLKNYLPVALYREKIIPAVKDGAILVFSCYYYIDKLQDYFQDPTFRVGYKDDVTRIRRSTWFTSSSLATVPNKLNIKNMHTPACVLHPANPEKWEVVAKQTAKSTGKETPYYLLRPYGKGMVVVGGAIGRNLPLLENLLEYNKVIRREKE